MHTAQTTDEALRIVLSGSFRRFYSLILERINCFESVGVHVTSPSKSSIVDPSAEFVLLASDAPGTPQQIEQRHLDAISAADALYVVNPGGYIGATTALEIGWALAINKPIFCQEECTEQLFSQLATVESEPKNVKQALLHRRKSPLAAISPIATLDQLQAYIRIVVKQRGFEQETARDIMLLMVEEVGELAKAIRKFSGLKVDPNKPSTRGNLQEEIADVFIYLLDLANSCDVDLFTAFQSKERRNQERTWKVHS